jgi:hypothetical protein
METKNIDNQIEEALKYDALSEAEKLTGKSYKEDEKTKAIGLLNFIQLNQRKNQLLSLTDDTMFDETESEYMRKVTDFGFKEVLLIPFINKEGIEERLHIMWHEEYSILLCWDTFTWKDDGSWAKAGEEVPPPSINGGNFYFNWAPNEFGDYPDGGSNGVIGNGDKNSTYSFLFNQNLTPHILPDELRMIEPKLDWDNYEEYKEVNKKWSIRIQDYIEQNNLISIYDGSFDCRVAIKHNINKLTKTGTFLSKWKEQPFLWLLHRGDTEIKNYDHKAINAKRITMLPKDIQEKIKGE